MLQFLGAETARALADLALFAHTYERQGAAGAFTACRTRDAPPAWRDQVSPLIIGIGFRPDGPHRVRIHLAAHSSDLFCRRLHHVCLQALIHGVYEVQLEDGIGDDLSLTFSDGGSLLALATHLRFARYNVRCFTQEGLPIILESRDETPFSVRVAILADP